MEDIIEVLTIIIVGVLPEKFRDWLSSHKVIRAVVLLVLYILAAVVCFCVLIGLLKLFVWIVNQLGWNVSVNEFLS